MNQKQQTDLGAKAQGWGNKVIDILLTIFIIAIVFGALLVGVIITNNTIGQIQSNIQSKAGLPTSQKVASFTLSSEIIVDPVAGLPTVSNTAGVFTITGWGQTHLINNFYTIATYGGLGQTGYPIFELGFDNNCVASAPDAFSILYLSGTTYSFSCLPPAITADNWVFYVLTYNGISGDTAITYEGVPNNFPYGATTGTVNSISSTFPLYANTIMTNNELVIGSDQWTGNITDIQVYNAILTSSQVNALFANGITASPILTSNVVGYYPLNGNANDLSGLNNNGVAISTSYVTLLLPPTSNVNIGTTTSTAVTVFGTLTGYLVTLSNFTGIIILLAIIVVVIKVLNYFFDNRIMNVI